jgi:hypothetical protein
MKRGRAGYPAAIKKKRLERELRALAEKQRELELERVHRKLATHAEVVAVAVHSPAIVPASALQDAIAGIHELTASFASEKPLRVPVAAQ